MTLAPLLAAPVLVQLHALAALGALGTGLWQLAGGKGTALHRRLGWVWAGLMAVVAVSSLGISSARSAGAWSWVHGMALIVLLVLPLGVMHARRGRIRPHRISMLALFLGALVIAGGFTLMPGRIMGRVVFGS
ncbi:MAG: hypothetical protein EON47_02635 [Acetobacteraceae bacterium]|nr:MAG: hypothetical protein EON47_02635 [Acetobacteraceae bacterium]